MNNAVFLMDVGGTRTRIRIVRIAAGMVSRPEILAAGSAQITRRDQLLDFISGLIRENGLQGRLQGAVACFAGVVTDATAELTNWPEEGVLGFQELSQAGLPAGRTVLANDMDAAAYGLVAGIRDELDLDLVPIYTPAASRTHYTCNAALVIPGTGVGVAGVLQERRGGNNGAVVPGSCEMQHTPIPELDAVQARVLAAMRAGRPEYHPTWEDFISGRGLENIHRHLNAATSGRAAALSAGEIAGQAVNGTDAVCAGALDIYYRCAGALAQVIALTFQAYGGIYLAGETTRRNLDFIRGSGFLEQLQTNPVRGDLLRDFPVYMVAGELNLDGAAYMARRIFAGHLQQAPAA